MQRNVLTAVFDGGFDCIAEAAAAGCSHPCDGDGPDIVVLKNLRQLLGVIHRIQLGAADHGHLMDVYLFCTDGLCGMMQAIEAVYPKSRLQRCIVHQIRSSTKYVSYKDIKQVVADLKKVYTAVTLEEAEANRESFAAKWRKQYPSCVKSWEENWEVLSTFFEYPQEIRKNHIHDEYHRRLEPAVPADHQEQAVVHQRRFSAPDAVSGVTAHREALACPVSELGPGTQPVGDHVRRPEGRLIPLG